MVISLRSNFQFVAMIMDTIISHFIVFSSGVMASKLSNFIVCCTLVIANKISHFIEFSTMVMPFYCIYESAFNSILSEHK